MKLETSVPATEAAMRLSVIIANYNYRAFVGAAISSALAIDWADKEVIVVDDASTDDSKSVIDGFQGRVLAYFRPKSHQLGAHRFGFARSSGSVIILLDADDLLEPEVMHEVAKVWRPGVSKVQYRMNLIDASGTQLGSAIPQFPPATDPEKLRRAFLRTMAYTTPPGSGNAYSRDFVQKAYAITPPTMRWSDDVLLTLAPMLGDVLTLRKPLARYRIHAANDGVLRSLDAAKLRNRLQQDVEKACLFKSVSQQHHLHIPRDPLGRSLHHLQYRFASYLVEPSAHPFPGDRLVSLVSRLVFSTTTSSQMSLRDKTLLLAWIVACALLPLRYRRSLLLWRFAAISRPPFLATALAAVGSLRSVRLPDRAGHPRST
jgi:glycosyltransferase involved in cell wall biosynthesis